MTGKLDNTDEPFNDDTSTETPLKSGALLLEQELLALENATQDQPEITREQLSLRKRFLNWRTILPLLIVLVAFSVFVLPTINIAQTWSTIRHASISWYLAAFVIYYLTFPLRAIRWKLLLENVGFSRENGVHLPPLWKIVEIIYVSYFVNVVVPAKLGDMYRAYLLRQEIGVSATRSFGTVLAERLLDLIVLLLLCIPAIMISLHDKIPPQVQFVLILLLVAVVGSVIALVIMHNFTTHIAKLIPPRFRAHYIHLQEGITTSFHRRLPALTGLTIATWVGEAMRFFFVALALNLFNGSLLHIIASAFVIGLVEALLTAIPSTGGGIGLVEGGMAAMIILLNPGSHASGNALAAAAIVLDRSVSFFSLLIIGFGVFMLVFGRQARKSARTPKS